MMQRPRTRTPSARHDKALAGAAKAQRGVEALGYARAPVRGQMPRFSDRSFIPIRTTDPPMHVKFNQLVQHRRG
jgi:hypothetical protein